MSLSRGSNRNVQNLVSAGSGSSVDGVPINPTKVTISGGSDDANALAVYDQDDNLIFNVNTVTDLVTINGDLFVNGTATFVETIIEEFKSPMIQLNTGEVAGTDVRDIGFYGGYTPVLTTFYCGLVRDASDNTFKFFTGNPTEPNLTVTSIDTYLADAALKTLNMTGDLNMKSGLFTISRGAGANDNVTFAQSGSGSMIFNVGGGTMFNFNTVAASIQIPLSLISSGSAAATAVNFGTAGTGFYGDSTTVRVATSGSLRLTIGTASIVSVLPVSLPSSGTASATMLNFGTAGTGIYGDATTLRFATVTALQLTISTAAITSTVPYVAPAGSTAATSYNFGTANTGIYGDSTTVRVSISNSNIATVDSTGISTTGTYQKSGTTILNSASTILAVGASAVAGVTSGTNLVGVGENALGAITTTSNSTGVGYNAARLVTGGDVTAVGSGALGAAGVSTGASAFGSAAARVNTAIRIAAFGFEALYNSTDSLNQAVFGYRAGYSQTNTAGGGGYTSAFGYAALTNATGSYNSGFGDSTGASLTTGQFNILVGAGSDVDVGARTNTIVVGRGAVSRAFDNSVTIGFGTTPITRVFIEGVNNNLIASPVGYVSCDSNGMIGYSTLPTPSSITLADGTLTSPSLSFVNNSNLGIYRPSANTMGFVSNNALSMSISDTAITTTIPLVLPATGTTANTMINFGTASNGIYGDATSVRIALAGGITFGVTAAGITCSSISRFGDGSAGLPAFGVNAEVGLGMYRSAVGVLSFSQNSTLRLSIATASITSTIPLLVPTGSASAPTFSFTADPNTGIYNSAADVLDFSTAGTNRLSLTSSTLISVVPIQFNGSVSGSVTLQAPGTITTYTMTLPTAQGAANSYLSNNGSGTLSWATAISPTTLSLADGTAGAPSLNFVNATTTGIYLAAANTLGISASGTLRLSVSSSNVTSTLAFLAPNGTASLPAYSFSGDPNTGIYSTAASDTIDFSAGGILRFTIATSTITSTIPFLAPNGTASLPAYSFSGDPNTGIYSAAASDTINFSAGGTLMFIVATTGIGIRSTAALVGNNGDFTISSTSNGVSTNIYTSSTTAGDLQTLYGTGIYNNTTLRTNAVWQQGVRTTTNAASSVDDRWYVGRAGVSGGDLCVFRDGVVGINVPTAPSGNFASTALYVVGQIGGTSTIIAGAGAVGTPSFSFAADPNTGIYNPSADNLGFSTNGTLQLTIATTTITSTLPLIVPTGLVGAPSIAFTGSLTTGIYSQSTNLLSFASSGTLRMTIGSSITTTVRFLAPAQDASFPSYSFSSDSDSGMYSISAFNLGFSTQNTLRFTISTATITSTIPLLAPNGTAALPAYSFSGDPNTGIYSAAASDTINFSAGGTLRFTIATDALTSTIPYIAPAGSVTATSFNFGTPGTGLYGTSTSVLHAISGVLRLTITTNSITSTVPYIAPAGSASASSFNFGTAGTGIYGDATNVNTSISNTLMLIVTTTGVGIRSTAILASVQGDFTIGSTAANVIINMNTSSTTAGSVTTQYGTGVYNAATTRNNAVWQWGLRTNTTGVTDINDRMCVARAGVSGGDFSVFRDGAVGINTVLAPTGTFASSLLYVVGQIGGTTTIIGGAGAVGAPTFSFAADSDTGIYNIGANSLGITTAGSLKLTVDASNITSTLPIIVPSGTASATSLNFGTTGTGIYGSSTTVLHSVANTLILTVAGTAVTSTVPYLANAGSVSAPSLGFSTSTNTGLYQTTDQVNIACTGFNAASFRNSAVSGYPLTLIANRARTFDGNSLLRAASNEGSNPLEMTWNFYGTALATWRMQWSLSQNGVGYIDFEPACRQILASNNSNTAALPIYSFLGDPNTGIYNPTGDNLGFSTNGTVRLTIATSSITSTIPLVLPAGTASATSLNFGTNGTGIYGSSNTILHAISNSLILSIAAAAVTSTVPYIAPVGAVGATAYNFGTAGTGYYSVSTTNLSASIGGIQSSALDYLTGLTVNQAPNTVVATSNTLSSVGSTSLVFSNNGSYAACANAFEATFRGTIYILTNANLTWSLQTTLVPTNHTGGAAVFGRNSIGLSADGTVLAFGGSEFNSNQGGVWVYTRSGTTWTQRTNNLVGTGAGTRRAFSVSMSKNGRTIISGCIDTPAGVQVWEGEGATWNQLGFYQGSGAVGAGEMGYSVDISADAQVIVFSAQADNSSVGAVWAFARSNNTYVQVGSKLVPTDYVSLTPRIGTFVCISPSGNTIAMSGTSENTQGAVWVFVKSAGVYVQDGLKIVPSTTATQIGQAIALVDDNTLLIASAAGTNTAWKYTKVSGTWTNQLVLATTNAVAGINGTPNGTQVSTITSSAITSQYFKTGSISGGCQVSSVGNLLAYQGSSFQTSYGSNLDAGNSGVYFPAIYEVALSAGGTRAFYGTETYSQIDQALYVTQGTAALPGISFINDSNTGIYSSLTDSVDVTCAGINVLDVASYQGINLIVNTSYSQMVSKLVGTGSAGASTNQGSAISLSADGSTLAIGGNTDNTSVGATWIFTRSGNVWSQQTATKLVGTGATGTSRQGNSVALSADGNTLAIGGDGDNTSVGAVWVFTRTGSTWTQQTAIKLVGTGATGTSRQGTSVSLSADGNTLAIGGDGDNGTIGATWVFTRSSGSWTQQTATKLVGTGATGTSNQGRSVSLSADGNTLAIGGTGDNSIVGATWVFTRSGSTWTQQTATKLVGTGATGTSAQGSSVSLSADGDTLATGGAEDNSSFGAVWVFTRSGTTWTQQTANKLIGTGSTGSTPRQGWSVSVSGNGNILAIGGYTDNSSQGSVWVFTRSGTTWTQLTSSKLVGTGATGSAQQGYRVSLSKNGAVLAFGGNNDNSNIGATWIYGNYPGNAVSGGYFNSSYTGSSALPVLNSTIDNGTSGIYWTAANSLGLSTNGILRLTVASTGLTAINVPIAIRTIGGGNNSGYYFRTSTDNSFRWIMDLSNETAGLTNTSLNLYGYNDSNTLVATFEFNRNQQLLLPAVNDATLPALSFSGDPNTGIYRSAADTMNFTTGGTSRMRMDTAEIVNTIPFRILGGTNSAPAYSFSGENTTGMYTTGTGNLSFTVSSTLRLAISTTAISASLNLNPSANNTYALGNTSLRWSEIWVQTGAFNTSDARTKDEIEPSDLGLNFIMALNPVKYKWKDTETQTYRRKFHGFIAQDVKSALDQLNVDTINFAGYADGNIRDNVDVLALRYTEFIAPLTKATQELKYIVDDKGNNIVALEARVHNLELIQNPQQINVQELIDKVSSYEQQLWQKTIELSTLQGKFDQLVNLLVASNVIQADQIL